MGKEEGLNDFSVQCFLSYPVDGNGFVMKVTMGNEWLYIFNLCTEMESEAKLNVCESPKACLSL